MTHLGNFRIEECSAVIRDKGIFYYKVKVSGAVNVVFGVEPGTIAEILWSDRPSKILPPFCPNAMHLL